MHPFVAAVIAASVAFTSVLFGQAVCGGHVGSLVNTPAWLLVGAVTAAWFFGTHKWSDIALAVRGLHSDVADDGARTGVRVWGGLFRISAFVAFAAPLMAGVFVIVPQVEHPDRIGLGVALAVVSQVYSIAIAIIAVCLREMARQRVKDVVTEGSVSVPGRSGEPVGMQLSLAAAHLPKRSLMPEVVAAILAFVAAATALTLAGGVAAEALYPLAYIPEALFVIIGPVAVLTVGVAFSKNAARSRTRFSLAAELLPLFGLVAALFQLIHVMENLDNPSELLGGIGTMVGLALAGVVFSLLAGRFAGKPPSVTTSLLAFGGVGTQLTILFIVMYSISSVDPDTLARGSACLAKEKAAAEPVVEQPAVEHKAVPFTFDALTVRMLGPGDSSYIRVDVTLELRNEDQVEPARLARAKLLEAMISLLSDKNAANVAGAAGIASLKVDLKACAERILGPNTVSGVLFTNLIVQTSGAPLTRP